MPASCRVIQSWGIVRCPEAPPRQTRAPSTPSLLAPCHPDPEGHSSLLPPASGTHFGCLTCMSQVMTPQSPDDPGEGSPKGMVPKTQRPGIVVSRGHGSDAPEVTNMNTLGAEGGQLTSAGNRTRSPEKPGATSTHTHEDTSSTYVMPEPRMPASPGCVSSLQDSHVRTCHTTGSQERMGLPVSPRQCQGSGYGHVIMSRQRRLKPLTKG